MTIRCTVLVASALLGLGVGAAFAAMAALIADNVDALEMGVASGMNTVVRMIGSVIGGQVAAALLTAQTIGDSSIPAESAFTVTFALSAVAALAAAGDRALDRLAAAARAARAGRSPALALLPRTTRGHPRGGHTISPPDSGFPPAGRCAGHLPDRTIRALTRR